MTAGVYAIINTANGMAYIGSSINIEARWQVHRSNLKLGYLLPIGLRDAWQAVGGTGFELRVLEEVCPDEASLVVAEQSWLDRYGDRAYNTIRVAKRYRRWARTRVRP